MAFTEKDKLKALAIVNIFETGRAFGDYSALAVLDDGAGISYGISQFTHKSGSLAAVIKRYFELGGVVGRAAIEERSALLRKKSASAIESLAADKKFQIALRSAAITREMREAQTQTAFELYLKPALDACSEKEFILPLSLTVVYDSLTHGSWEKIAEKVRRGDVETRGQSEKNWITEYVRVRDEWLAGNPRLRKTRYRTEFFLKQINADNWRLELPVSVNGVKLIEETIAAKTSLNTEVQQSKDKIGSAVEILQPHLPGLSEIEIKKNYSVKPTPAPPRTHLKPSQVPPKRTVRRRGRFPPHRLAVAVGRRQTRSSRRIALIVLIEWKKKLMRLRLNTIRPNAS
jgi:hypothetical protein